MVIERPGVRIIPFVRYAHLFGTLPRATVTEMMPAMTALVVAMSETGGHKRGRRGSKSRVASRALRFIERKAGSPQCKPNQLPAQHEPRMYRLLSSDRRLYNPARKVTETGWQVDR